jgi:xanthosine utilization system XapX-like protein
MKLLYKPFALIAGIIGARLGRSIFKALWAKLDGAEAPSETAEDVSLGKVVGAKALEAATLAATAAATDRAGRRSFQYLFGVWPGGKQKYEGD